ncbi:MAG: alpha-E domain-containing protein [Ectothiorhodospira sp.]
MLSRVAERLYWMARYLERAENTARMVTAFNHLALDMPRHVRLSWRGLVAITGNEAAFEARYPEETEAEVIRFLLGDQENPGSILNCLTQARENVRTTRDRVPTEVWETVNELHLHARLNLDAGEGKRGRYRYLAQIRDRCQQITGMLAGTMSHDQGYEFIRAGRNLERADMTSRLLDVGAVGLLPREDEVEGGETGAMEGLLWMHVLRSLSAFQMYRQHVRRRINPADVLRYLVQDTQFPRAIAHALGEVEGSLARLPRNDLPLRMALQVKRHALEARGETLLDARLLHRFIDDLQGEMGELHGLITANWFHPDPYQTQAQTQVQGQTGRG